MISTELRYDAHLADSAHVRYFFAISTVIRTLVEGILENRSVSESLLSTNYIGMNWASFWENRSSGFPTRSHTHRSVQPQKVARVLRFRI